MTKTKKEVSKINTEDVVLEDKILDEIEEVVTVESSISESSEDDSTEEMDRSKGEWYILQTYSGQEYKVKLSLDNRISALKLNDKVFEILIPEEDIIEVKNNKRVERAKKMYPGYIFVRMIYDNELWYVIKRIPGISKFMGNQNIPMAVTDGEMLKVLRQVGVKLQKYKIDFEVGDVVKIIAGPFRGYTGPVTDISMDKGKLKSLLLIFGRETPVEIDFDQVEKAVQ